MAEVNPIFVTQDDVDEVLERQRQRLDVAHLMSVWDAYQKGHLDDVPTVS